MMALRYCGFCGKYKPADTVRNYPGAKNPKCDECLIAAIKSKNASEPRRIRNGIKMQKRFAAGKVKMPE